MRLPKSVAAEVERLANKAAGKACAAEMEGGNMVVWIPTRVSSTGGAASPNYAAFLTLTRPGSEDTCGRKDSRGELEHEQEYLAALRPEGEQASSKADEAL